MANEQRLIDANWLLEEYCDGCEYRNTQTCFDDICAPVKLIQAAPTVDAVEVVHGHWVATPVRKLNSKGTVVYYCDNHHCSKCGTDRPIVPPYNYCPNCGAKMDGGNEE